jgi:methylase of polypeptide subunit release factors
METCTASVRGRDAVADCKNENPVPPRTLNAKQRDQLQRQLAAHTHRAYEIDLELPSLSLARFAVHSDVMRPELMSSWWLARYLSTSPSAYRQKSVIDMGCGCGIQGIIAALKDAESVIFSDLSVPAIGNTAENIQKFGISAKCSTVRGDLFENVGEPADVIIFNHPFFPGDPIPNIPVSLGMLDSGGLIHRFFEAAKSYCNDRIIMPFFHLAGETNDPGVQAPKHGWKIDKRSTFDANDGLQRGRFSIYEIEAS